MTLEQKVVLTADKTAATVWNGLFDGDAVGNGGVDVGSNSNEGDGDAFETSYRDTAFFGTTRRVLLTMDYLQRGNDNTDDADDEESGYSSGWGDGGADDKESGYSGNNRDDYWDSNG